MQLLRRRKLTIERHETTTTVRIVAEDTAEVPVPVEPAVWETWMALDKDHPLELTEPAPVFWHLLRHPPVKARWRAHLDFTADETARAVASGHVQIPAAQPYPELDEATLAQDFAELGDDRLVTTAWSQTPLELTLGRST